MMLYFGGAKNKIEQIYRSFKMQKCWQLAKYNMENGWQQKLWHSSLCLKIVFDLSYLGHEIEKKNSNMP